MTLGLILSVLAIGLWLGYAREFHSELFLRSLGANRRELKVNKVLKFKIKKKIINLKFLFSGC